LIRKSNWGIKTSYCNERRRRKEEEEERRKN
jgi:hypothetical protein